MDVNCLGWCKRGPCVNLSSDFDTVSGRDDSRVGGLAAQTPVESQHGMFFGVRDGGDVERVVECALEAAGMECEEEDGFV